MIPKTTLANTKLSWWNGRSFMMLVVVVVDLSQSFRVAWCVHIKGETPRAKVERD
jgi:hypothetical protein